MARKRLVDHNALVQAIEMGKPSQEIMQQFGLKSLGALKVAYMDALIALDKVPAVKKGTKGKESQQYRWNQQSRQPYHS